MPTTLDEFLAELNATLFLREFSYTRSTFAPAVGTELEFADHVVWIDDLLMIYQLKERSATAPSSAEREATWFKRKVLGAASRQVRGTLAYLREYPDIQIRNQRGHLIKVKTANIRTLVKLIIYAANPSLPDDLRAMKYRVSRHAGFIHIFRARDYFAMSRTLLTPAEIALYLEFREQIFRRFAGSVSEKALVGQFISRDFDTEPSEQYGEYVLQLKDGAPDLDIYEYLFQMGDNIRYPLERGCGTDYYEILAEFAKLTRNHLREATRRFKYCIDGVLAQDGRRPAQMIVPYTGCGFVFIPLPQDLAELRYEALKCVTYAAQCNSGVDRQVGIQFSSANGKLVIDWCYCDDAWVHDPVMEKAADDLFIPLEMAVRPVYEFK